MLNFTSDITKDAEDFEGEINLLRRRVSKLKFTT